MTPTTGKTLKALAVMLLIGCVTHRVFGQQFAVNYSAAFNWPVGATNGDLCGLYAQSNTNTDAPHFIAATTFPNAGITFSVTNPVNGYVMPNPAYLSVQVQRGTNSTAFSSTFFLDTNNYPEPFNLGPPVLLKLTPRY